LPTPDSTASSAIAQKAGAKDVAAIESAISSVPPTRKGRAPQRSTQNPTGVCSAAVVALISAAERPRVA
jgi:hypothetical protein